MGSQASPGEETPAGRAAGLSPRTFCSWGRIVRADCLSAAPAFPDGIPGALAALGAVAGSALAFGCGRSYGDSCLNSGGGMLRTGALDRVHGFDRSTGILRADCGLTLAQMHGLTIPHGWLVPVTPGTKFVTLGGAVANDVHGKNHHRAGSFGCHVRGLGLRRTDGTVLECGRDRETGLFAATIGGLGLTGIIEWVELQLMPIASSEIEFENMRFASLDGFFELSEASRDWEYTVAWVDCLARGARTGRGVFSRGRHAAAGVRTAAPSASSRLAVPFALPFSLVHGASVRAFNEFYYRRPAASSRGRRHFDPFVYPLDGVLNWNRVYGPRGFYQYQCVIPAERAREGVGALLERIAASGQGSFLTVLKNFGERASPGLLSFPRGGTTFAVDFPNRGTATLGLLAALDEVVAVEGGRLYPAKDGRMPAAMFQAGYPGWRAFREFRDPGLRSDFWTRVSAE